MDQKNPGKPEQLCTSADSITLTWAAASPFDEDDFYQLSYKDVNSRRWKNLDTEFKTNMAEVRGLKSKCKYVFRVRVAYADKEGPYSPESNEFVTVVSPASRIVESLQQGEKSNHSPVIYTVPLNEIRGGRNEGAKTKKYEIGNPHALINEEKTIMLVGATGAGKSTLVDGFVNYVMGVNFSDPFRLTVINLEEEEKKKCDNQAESQTEWITCYTMNAEEGGRLNYKLNIIDTPGFGDTRGLIQDQRIVDQMRTLFSSSGTQGVSCLNAVCFLIKAPDARLTHVQKYIFESILSLFGKNIESNISYLVTFADGTNPPVLAALKASSLPAGETFTFNSSGLFARNVDLDVTSMTPSFWDMGLKSFSAFFKHLEFMDNRSMQMTKNVLETRNRLEMTVKNIQPKIDVGFALVDQLGKDIQLLETHKADIKDNANFQLEGEVTELVPRAITPMTYCNCCCFTCHSPCAYDKDSEKGNCYAMSGEKCTVCPNRCHWTQHKSFLGPSIEYVVVKKKVIKTLAEMQKKYQKASGELPTQEQVVEKLHNELENLRRDIEGSMNIVKRCNEELKEIALRPNPLSMTDYIDIMIQCEMKEKNEDFKDRIKVLEEFRERAKISSKLNTGNTPEPLTNSNISSNLSRMKNWLVEHLR